MVPAMRRWLPRPLSAAKLLSVLVLAPALVLSTSGLGLDVAKAAPPSGRGPARGVTARPAPTFHTVYQGQTLGMIAKRYNVTVEALCDANALTRRNPIKPGQKLVIPDKNYVPGALPTTLAKPNTAAPAATVNSTPTQTKQDLDREAAEDRTERARAKRLASWKKYVRPARRAGYVTLKATGRDWQGYAVVKGNRISPGGLRGFRHALYSWRTGAETDISPSLIRLLVKVSDTFGGRTLHIVSGYREHSYAKESKHKKGHACDLSVEGVPNDVLRDYLLTLDQVGVGYYPNSSFVHLDVRPQSTQWVDRASPGERPEYDHVAAR
jgi:uncharacterized protein YcbK (DUF882 family)